jgi:hypothetical protein
MDWTTDKGINMKKKLPDPKLVSRKEYKYDRAMLEAIKRMENHPKPIAISSNVKQVFLGGDR